MGKGGSRPGERRGGRQKGTKNRQTLAIEEIFAKRKFDPIEGMIDLAQDEKCSPELRGKMLAELAQYLHPKRKALEHSGADGGPLTVIVRSVLQKPPEVK